MAVMQVACLIATGTHVLHGITQCYLSPGRGDIAASSPANYRAGFKGDPWGPGPRLPTNRGPLTKPFIFFSFVICVCVTLGFYSLPLIDPK